jgi:outer membrane protein TolC
MSMNEFRRLAAKMDQHMQQLTAQGDDQMRARTGHAAHNLAILKHSRGRAQYGITSAAQLPTVAATAQGCRSRTAADLSSTGQLVTSNQYAAQLAVTSFELDLWGRVRNFNEAALQQFLQSEVNQLNVQTTLVTDITITWLNLAANEARLTLARDTLAGREKAYQLTERIRQKVTRSLIYKNIFE